jgi:outer membrane murein-binding lipoprotein Lpp
MRRAVWLAAGAFVLASLTPEGARASDDIRALERKLDALAAQNQQMQETIRVLERDVREARNEARAAEDLAREAVARPQAVGGFADDGALFSRPLGGGARLQLLDISLDVLGAAGASSAEDGELAFLQGGEHDPHQRGYSLQQLELGFKGAVDPFFTGEAYLVYFLDPDGESRFELEEVFATTLQLPWALEEHGLQLELGQFFTAFGRQNQMHPHEWDWQDQPIVLSRFLGGDGMRQTGVAARWLTPLPWYSELTFTSQNADGETMLSFLANDEVFQARPIARRPFAEPSVHSVDDLVYTTRWVNAFDVSDTWSTQLGASWATGPNATGRRTQIVGGDVLAKWIPLSTDRGWPYVELQSELLYRHYDAGSFAGCLVEAPSCAPVQLASETLRDWGFYAQALWGFRRGWATGLRVEHATGSESDLISRNDDPFRSNRWRLSPLLSFHPSQFSRLRLQYNYDHASHLADDDAHTLWAGLEFLFGAHPAHAY